MRQISTVSHDQMSRDACDVVLHAVRLKRDLLLCAATRHSPQRTYEYLAEYHCQVTCIIDLETISVEGGPAASV